MPNKSLKNSAIAKEKGTNRQGRPSRAEAFSDIRLKEGALILDEGLLGCLRDLELAVDLLEVEPPLVGCFRLVDIAVGLELLGLPLHRTEKAFQRAVPAFEVAGRGTRSVPRAKL